MIMKRSATPLRRDLRQGVGIPNVSNSPENCVFCPNHAKSTVITISQPVFSQCWHQTM
jgi:hypothetical protein